jgi:cytochrome P450
MIDNTQLAESEIDLWSDNSLLDPFDNYRALRDTAPVVVLKKYGVLALPRFDDVRNALRNWQVFSSSYGVGMNEENNRVNRGSLLTSDGPEHVALRKIIGRPLGSQAMSQLRDTIAMEADSVASRIAELGDFDGVRDLAWHLPLAVVRALVGLPEKAVSGCWNGARPASTPADRTMTDRGQAGY